MARALEILKSNLGMVKLATVVMGVMLMGFGLHSHFQSGWNKKIWVNSDGKLTQLYHVCKLYKNSDLKCPGISKERFFVSMVIIHFFVSIASLVLTVLDKTKENVKIKWGDIIYHVVMGLLLLSSSVLYITSANQINKFVNDDYGVPVNVKMLRGEKLVAGTFGFVQGVLYWVVSFFVFRHG